MPEQIDTITEEQYARMPEWIEKWTKIGVCTEPADFQSAIDAVLKCYDAAGLKRPQYVLRATSPLAAHYGASIIAALCQIRRDKQAETDAQKEKTIKTGGSSKEGDIIGQAITAHQSDIVGAGTMGDEMLSLYLSGDGYQRGYNANVIDRVRAQGGVKLVSDSIDQAAITMAQKLLTNVFVTNNAENNEWRSLFNVLNVAGGDDITINDAAFQNKMFGRELSLSVNPISWPSMDFDSPDEQLTGMAFDFTGDVNDIPTILFNNDKFRDGERVLKVMANQNANKLVQQLLNKFRLAIETGRYNYRGGQFWSAWCAYISFFRDVCGWENPTLKEFALDEILTKSCGWIWWHEDVLAIAERPTAILRDNAGRLHCDDGPAIQFRDGWGVCCWHGFRLAPDKEWVILQKHMLTPETIDNESNAEQRRILLEIFGFDKYMEARGAKLIAEDVNHGQPRRLLDITVRGETIRVLEVVNGSLEPDGTRRKFVLGAVRHPQTRELPTTPHEAVAWSYGRPADQYEEAVRT